AAAASPTAARAPSGAAARLARATLAPIPSAPSPAMLRAMVPAWFSAAVRAPLRPLHFVAVVDGGAGLVEVVAGDEHVGAGHEGCREHAGGEEGVVVVADEAAGGLGAADAGVDDLTARVPQTVERAGCEAANTVQAAHAAGVDEGGGLVGGVGVGARVGVVDR